MLDVCEVLRDESRCEEKKARVGKKSRVGRTSEGIQQEGVDVSSSSGGGKSNRPACW